LFFLVPENAIPDGIESKEITMKTGDKIKAFVQIGLMRKPRWVVGQYVAQEGDNHKVFVASQDLTLAWNKVKLYQPVEYKDGFCVALDDFVENNWEELKSVITDSVGHFFPGEPVSIDENEHMITVMGISVASGVTEVETIASFREIPSWIVSYYESIPATYWDPPDADEVVCGNSPGVVQAARILIDGIWKFKADGYWESQYDQIEA
jgi:hypothetical protein